MALEEEFEGKRQQLYNDMLSTFGDEATRREIFGEVFELIERVAGLEGEGWKEEFAVQAKAASSSAGYEGVNAGEALPRSKALKRMRSNDLR
ncbi:hypothetical protein RUND412_011220 [Rhizina undulata]